MGRDDDRATTRLEAFSDGVIAIAITLLVLEIDVPRAGPQTLRAALLAQWPSYLSYVASFLVIGIIWANHHHSFKYIRRTDHALRMINMLFLMSVAFIPFPTALLGEYLRQGQDARTAAAVYSGTMLAMAILYNGFWRYGSGNPRLVDPAADPRVLRSITRRYLIGLPLYLLSFAAAFSAPGPALPSGRSPGCSTPSPAKTTGRAGRLRVEPRKRETSDRLRGQPVGDEPRGVSPTEAGPRRRGDGARRGRPTLPPDPTRRGCGGRTPTSRLRRKQATERKNVRFRCCRSGPADGPPVPAVRGVLPRRDCWNRIASLARPGHCCTVSASRAW